MIQAYLKKVRVSMGVTQQRLAELTQLSIATIQKFESPKSNPTLEVIHSISSALGCSFEIAFQRIDWSALIQYGLPLVGEKENKIIKNKSQLKNLLIRACFSIKNAPQERERVALESYIYAIKNHYPVFFKENLNMPIIKEFLPKSLSGKHIKLYRISRAALGDLL